MPSIKNVLFWVGAILVLAITMSYYWFEYKKILQTQEAIEKREAILKEKRDNVQTYKEKVEFYQTREGIEHLAREQYNLVTSGERVIILKQDGEPQ